MRRLLGFRETPTAPGRVEAMAAKMRRRQQRAREEEEELIFARHRPIFCAASQRVALYIPLYLLEQEICLTQPIQ